MWTALIRGKWKALKIFWLEFYGNKVRCMFTTIANDYSIPANPWTPRDEYHPLAFFLCEFVDDKHRLVVSVTRDENTFDLCDIILTLSHGICHDFEWPWQWLKYSVFTIVCESRYLSACAVSAFLKYLTGRVNVQNEEYIFAASFSHGTADTPSVDSIILNIDIVL